jgi:hypothetical protein
LKSSISFQKKISFVLISFLISSCCIQKRHYTSGYYVEWHRNNKIIESTLKKAQPIAKEEITTSSPEAKIITQQQVKLEQKSIRVAEVNKNNKTTSLSGKKKSLQIQSEEKNKSTISVKAQVPASGASSGADAPAALSATTGFISVLSLMFSVILLASGATILGFAVLIIGALMALIAIILGATYLAKTKGNLDKAMDRHLARKGMTMGISFFLIILLFMGLIALIISLG